MDAHRRPLNSFSSVAGEPLMKSPPPAVVTHSTVFPLYITNGVFFSVFFFVAYFLLTRWREKIRTPTPLHVVTLSEMVAILSLIAFVIYLFGFFSNSLLYPRTTSDDNLEDDVVLSNDDAKPPCAAGEPTKKLLPKVEPLPGEDAEIVREVVEGFCCFLCCSL